MRLRYFENRLRLLDGQARMAENLLSRRRRHHRLVRALEDSDAEIVFQLLQLPAQRRLAHAARLRGASEVAVVRNGDQVLQVSEVHGNILTK